MSDEAQRAKDLLRTLAHKGFKRDRSETKAYRYTGRLKAAGREVSVSITFPDLEFTRLPELTLLNPEQEAPHVVAHLTASGGLCFARNEDLVLDRNDVGGTALMCLELARRGLERALTHKHLEQEIAQEFPQHWLGMPFYYDISATDHDRAKLYLVPRNREPARFLLTDRENVLKRLLPDDAARRKVIASSHPAFVFQSNTDLTFGRDHRQPQTLAAFIAWLESILSDTGKRAINELTGRFPDHLVSLFVNAPNGCVGILVDASQPILKGAQRRQGLQRIAQANAAKIGVQRYSGTRIDLPFVFRRNMNSHTPLTGRRIALVGCGTIGSHLAKFLVQSGAGHDDGTLLVLDNQTLEPGNVGRHYLGTTSIGDSKPGALKGELLRQFPEANILPMTADAEGFLETLAGYDLIVDATGEEALSMSINHHFVAHRRDHETAPGVLHVRLFGNGAAAQTLLVDGPDFACFKCLKPDHGGNWRFSPLKSGVAATQTVAACGESQYIAYGVAAPAMAAALALQLILDWNNGTPAPRMRTIRIEKKDTQEVADKNPDRSPRCPACGNHQA